MEGHIRSTELKRSVGAFAKNAGINSVVSSLCYGCQWDAMCRYIGDCQRTGSGDSVDAHTGSDKKDVSKNIYDLAGLQQEWTLEADGGTKRVVRGGTSTSIKSISSRESKYSGKAGYLAGYRPTLYIK